MAMTADDALVFDPDRVETEVSKMKKTQIIELVCGISRKLRDQFEKSWGRRHDGFETQIELHNEPMAYTQPPFCTCGEDLGASIEGWHEDRCNRVTLTHVEAVDDVVRVTFCQNDWSRLFRIMLDKKGAKRLSDAISFAATQAVGDTLAEFEECCHAPKAEARLEYLLYDPDMKPKEPR